MAESYLLIDRLQKVAKIEVCEDMLKQPEIQIKEVTSVMQLNSEN